MEIERKVLLRDSVVVINLIKGDTLRHIRIMWIRTKRNLYRQSSLYKSKIRLFRSENTAFVQNRILVNGAVWIIGAAGKCGEWNTTVELMILSANAQRTKNQVPEPRKNCKRGTKPKKLQVKNFHKSSGFLDDQLKFVFVYLSFYSWFFACIFFGSWFFLELLRISNEYHYPLTFVKKSSIMNYRRLGRSGIQVSVLSFGSWVTFTNRSTIAWLTN
jgi:hypothetical protein